MPGLRVSSSIMELMFYITAFAATMLVLLFILTSTLFRHRLMNSRTSIPSSMLPPTIAFPSWSLFGHLSLLGRYPHRALTQLSRQLGPVYSLQFGRQQVVVVNSQATIRAAFSTVRSAGRLLDDRPDFELYRHYAGGCSISFGRRGAAVRLHRRLARGVVRRLVTSGLAESIVVREATALVAAWIDGTDHLGRCVDPADDLTLAVGSALFSMCYGADARIVDDPDYHQLLKSKGANSDVFAIAKQGDLVASYLRRFIVDSEQKAAVVQQMATHVRLNAARIQHRSTLTTRIDDDQCDVLDVVLTAASSPTTVDRMHSTGLTHAHLTSMPLEFLSAGSETSSATLIWILRFMVMHPDVQRRVHAELDAQLDVGRPVTSDDRRRLPYVEAVIQEAMRLCPVVPLALPHYTDVDVDVDVSNQATTEYFSLTITAGSVVIANLWSVGRDPDVWREDVDSFLPERFLRDGAAAKTPACNRTRACSFDENSSDTEVTAYSMSRGTTASDVDASGNEPLAIDRRLTELFYPFGCGARRCVGEPLGRLQIFLFFATIMRSCRLLPLEGKPPPPYGESYGDVIRPASHQILIFPR